MRGSILVTFDETTDNRGIDYYAVSVNNEVKNVHYTDSNNLYSTYLEVGDVVTFDLMSTSGISNNIEVTRIDFTTDDEGGDKGIKQTPINPTIITGTSSQLIIEFTGTTRPDAYNFHYLINALTIPCFNIGSGFTGGFGPGGGFVSDIEQQSDKNLLFAGSYSNYDGSSILNLCRTDEFGDLDTSFLFTGPNVAIFDIVIQLDGKIIIISNTNGIYRINNNGSIDTGFTSGTTSNTITQGEEICSLQSDGKIIFGAAFTGYTGSTVWNQTGLVRLNTNGSVDTTWNSGGTGITFDNVQGSIREVLIQDDTKIMIGGQVIRFYNGTEINGLTRLNSDGSLDTGFTNYNFSNPSPTVNAICKLSSGKYIIGCENIAIYSGITVGHLFGLNSDGSFDTTFPYNQITSISGTDVQDIIELSNGKILVGGNFTTYSGQSVSSVIMLNTDGTLDTSFNTGTGFGGATNLVRTLLEIPNQRILIGGDFATYNGVTVNKSIRVNFFGILENC
jgi:uncharacterized delta-60 repeat protein